MTDDPETREAAHGKRMIEIKVRLWTDGLADGKGKIRPRHAWTAGVVRIERNDAHGIVPIQPLPFNSLMDIPSKIEKVIIDHGITLHESQRMSKYMRGQ
jgi:hypothetical protein